MTATTPMHDAQKIPTAHPQLDGVWSTRCAVDLNHRVWWSDDVLAPGNAAFAAALAQVHGNCVAFIDSEVAQSWPVLARQLMGAFAALQPSASSPNPSAPCLAHVEIIPGGEKCKEGFTWAQRVAKICFDHGVSRHGAVIAIGGGAALDAVGFGAAIAHRGVRIIRVPTTTLAQDDSAMGVKCGVNMFEQKNALGCFAAPWAVLCDEKFLTTLPIQHWLGGFSEAVKIALLKDAPLFEQLENCATSIVSRDMKIAAPILRRSAWLHREHILRGGDPFEIGDARPLDHGHWSAHRLETLSHFAVPHGQAVSIGIALDAFLAVEMSLLKAEVATRIIQLLRSLQLPVWHELLESGQELFAGLEQFRQHIGGHFAISLLTDIGASQEVTRISAEDFRNAVTTLRANAS